MPRRRIVIRRRFGTAVTELPGSGGRLDSIRSQRHLGRTGAISPESPVPALPAEGSFALAAHQVIRSSYRTF
jgi:hypothetical protein